MGIQRVCGVVIVCALIALSSGCASITGTTNQSVSVQTLAQDGKEVAGVLCELSNNKGKWFVTTPGSVLITRSNDDMQVACNKAGAETGRAAVVSGTKAGMFGNIIFGGGIGAIIDHNSGAAYEYPNFLQIVMGATSRIEPPKEGEQGQQAAQGQPAPQQPQPPAAKPQAVSATVTPEPPILKGTVEERLRELKRLHEAGLISNEVYAEQQRKTMELPR